VARRSRSRHRRRRLGRVPGRSRLPGGDLRQGQPGGDSSTRRPYLSSSCRRRRGLQPPDDPRRGGADGGVTYIVFTGAENRVHLWRTLRSRARSRAARRAAVERERIGRSR